MSEFPQNCSAAPLPLYRTTAYLAHYTTGLNFSAFAHACQAASALHMAPSTDFVTIEICSGADPTQWADTADAIGSTPAAVAAERSEPVVPTLE